jgi:hypothetical protein
MSTVRENLMDIDDSQVVVGYRFCFATVAKPRTKKKTVTRHRNGRTTANSSAKVGK